LNNVKSKVKNMLFDVHNKKVYRAYLIELLVNEMLSEFKKKVRERTCPYCDMQFKTYNALKSHIVVKHRSEFSHSVSIVAKVYTYIKSKMVRGSDCIYLCIPSVNMCIKQYKFKNIESLAMWLRKNKDILNYIIDSAFKNQ